jgi:hypothetical protein
MTENVWFVAAIWMALAFAASLISIWTGISADDSYEEEKAL